MSNINYADVCCGLAWGDEGKGKIVSQLRHQGHGDRVSGRGQLRQRDRIRPLEVVEETCVHARKREGRVRRRLFRRQRLQHRIDLVTSRVGQSAVVDLTQLGTDPVARAPSIIIQTLDAVMRHLESGTGVHPMAPRRKGDPAGLHIVVDSELDHLRLVIHRRLVIVIGRPAGHGEHADQDDEGQVECVPHFRAPLSISLYASHDGAPWRSYKLILLLSPKGALCSQSPPR